MTAFGLRTAAGHPHVHRRAGTRCRPGPRIVRRSRSRRSSRSPRWPACPRRYGTRSRPARSASGRGHHAAQAALSGGRRGAHAPDLLPYPQGPGSGVRPLLARGSAANVLGELGGTAEMVVVGSRGRGGVAGLKLGSTAWQVAVHGHGPVVVVRGAVACRRPCPGPGSGRRGRIACVPGRDRVRPPGGGTARGPAAGGVRPGGRARHARWCTRDGSRLQPRDDRARKGTPMSRCCGRSREARRGPLCWPPRPKNSPARCQRLASTSVSLVRRPRPRAYEQGAPLTGGWSGTPASFPVGLNERK
jgi:hypothetical protein